MVSRKPHRATAALDDDGKAVSLPTKALVCARKRTVALGWRACVNASGCRIPRVDVAERLRATAQPLLP